MVVFAAIPAAAAVAKGTTAVSIFTAIGKLGKTLFGGKKGVFAAGAGGGVLGSVVGGPGSQKRRRRRARFTNREIQDLMLLKQIVGTRSPLLTIAGMRMLSRGG